MMMTQFQMSVRVVQVVVEDNKLINCDREILKKLVKLSDEHPDLPIITLVDTEVVADLGHTWWLSRIYSIDIDKYFVGDEYVYLYSESEYDDIFWADVDLEEANKMFEELPWKEAIIMRVGTCEQRL